MKYDIKFNIPKSGIINKTMYGTMSNFNFSTIQTIASIDPFRLTSQSAASRSGRISFIINDIVTTESNSTDAAKQRAAMCLTAE